MNQTSLKQNLVNIPGIIELDDYIAENYSGGNFYIESARGAARVDTDIARYALSSEDRYLSLINTNDNADDRLDEGHAFSVTFRNSAGEGVAYGNVTYGEGIRAEQLDSAIALGATAFEVRQGDPTSICNCLRLF